MCKTQKLLDGKEITTVYPAVKFRKTPLPMANVSFCEDTSLSREIDERQNIFKITMECHQKRNRFYHTFLNNMPVITKECINSSEYYFEDGLRKVR